jgi:superfamily II DNA or RNA helicase
MGRFPRLVGTPAFKSLLGGVVTQNDDGSHEAPPVAPPPVAAVAVSDPAVVGPDGMNTRPWRHQLAAYRFCLEHFAKGQHGLLLAMMMGTGKTLVGFMVMLERRAKRTLILCPLRVVPVWATQIERHVATPMVVVSLDDSVASVRRKQEVAAEKLKLAEALEQPFICVINYDSFWREPFNAWAEKLCWDVMILDEAHTLRPRAARRRSRASGCGHARRCAWE